MSDLSRRLAKYGLTPHEYEALRSAQAGCCSICAKPFSAAKSRRRCGPPSVDHDHSTGAVRGLLCASCNQLIGFLHEDADLFYRAWQHLTDPVADHVFDTPRLHVDAPPTRSTT